MRKLIVVLVSFLVLLMGCSGGDGEVKTASISSEASEENERTIDLMGESPFSTGAGKVAVGKWIDDGETVFILSDGQELEEKIANSIAERDKEIKETEEKAGYEIDDSHLQYFQLKTYEDSIDIFAKNILRDYPDKEEYIKKLREANEAIKDEDEEKVKQKIKEARKLRESQ